jgi:hypothetical protein
MTMMMRLQSIPRARRERPDLRAVEQLSAQPQEARVDELVRWSMYLDPGGVDDGAQRAAAVDALVELAERSDDLRAAWLAGRKRLRAGDVTRSAVALLADAMGRATHAPRSKAS